MSPNWKPRALVLALVLGLGSLALAADPVERAYSVVGLQQLTESVSTVSTTTPAFGSALTLSTRSLAKCNIVIAPRLSVASATVSFKLLYWDANGSFETTSEIYSVAAGIESVGGRYHAPGQLIDSLGSSFVSIQITTAPSSGTVVFYGKAY